MRKILLATLILFSGLAFANPPGTFQPLLLTPAAVAVATDITSINNTSNIGNMNDGGGLASAFNGTLTGKTCSAAGTAAADQYTTNSYVGRAYSGAGHSLSYMETYSNSGGYANQAGTCTLSLYGKNGTPASPSDGTLLGSTSVSCASVTQPVTINSSNTVTTYTNIWFRNSGGPSGGSICVTQVKFFGF